MELLELGALAAALFWCAVFALRITGRLGHRRGRRVVQEELVAAGWTPAVPAAVEQPLPALPAPALVGPATP